MEWNHRPVKRFILPLAFVWRALMCLAVSGRVASPALSPGPGEIRVRSCGSR
jgi:hypothetical protein